MADHGQEHEHTKGGAHANHILPQTTIAMVAGALFALMVITIAAAFMVPEGLRENTFLMQSIALAIAVVKASLVIYYYMGVKFGTRLVKIFAYGGFVWFLLLYVMMADYTTRPMEPVVGWESDVSSALPRNTAENPD